MFNQITAAVSAQHIEEQDGSLLERGAEAFVFYNGPRETFGQFRIGRRNKVFSQVIFDQQFSSGHIQTRASGALMFGAQFRWGDQIDFAYARPGDEVSVGPFITYNLGRHWLLQYKHTFESLDVLERRLFSVNVSESRVVYQLDTRTFVRAILQYTDVQRNPALYSSVVKAESGDLFTQLLISYKVNPQTVLYLGYADNDIGNNQFRLTQADRTFFVKACYAWQP